MSSLPEQEVNSQQKPEQSKGPKETDQPKKRSKRRKVISIIVIIVGIGLLTGGTWLYVQKYGVPEVISRYYEKVQSEDEGPEEIELCIGRDVMDTAVETVESWAASEELSEKEVNVTHIDDAPPRSCDIAVTSSDSGSSDLVYRNYYVVIKNKGTDLASLPAGKLSVLLGQGSVDIEGEPYRVLVDEVAFEPMDRTLGLGVNIEPSEDVLAQVLANPDALGIIPFDDLPYTVDAVAVEDISLLTSGDISGYLLKEEVWLKEGEKSDLFAQLQEAIGSGNYDQNAIKTVVMTGTSVVGARGHYQQSVAADDWMNAVRDVGDILRDADISHISNEGSFVPGCVQNTWTMVFCGPEEAFELLTWSGIDVVGLTGNHILDFSDNNFLATLNMYEDAGIEYFGGGRDYDDAHAAAVKDLGSIKVGFLGYNMIPPISSFATGDNPGSAELQVAAIQKDIAAIREEVDIIFVDMQWGNEYEHQPNSYQIDYGHAAIDAGADIVSGVHPHWVQPVEYYNDGVIFYSLGNFIFDQLWSLETREGVMVKHFFYNDRYVGYELIPTLLSADLQVERATGEDAKRITGYVLDGLAE